MTPFQELKAHLNELKREGKPKPPAIATTHLNAEALIIEAMQCEPNNVHLKPGKITIKGVRIIPMTASELAAERKRYEAEHPIVMPERSIILPGDLYG